MKVITEKFQNTWFLSEKKKKKQKKTPQVLAEKQ